MTTHMKAPSGTGHISLCGDFEPSCQLTDDIAKITCPDCIGALNANVRIDMDHVQPWEDHPPRAKKQDHVDVYPSTFDMQDPNKDVTTHMKAKKGSLFKALCEGWVHGDLLTDRFWESNCPDCLLTWKQEQDRESGPAETASPAAGFIGFQLYDDPSSTQVGGDHYTLLDVQPWDAMVSWMSPVEFEGFLKGNAIKYLARAGAKGPPVEDYKKARHYLDKLIEVIEA